MNNLLFRPLSLRHLALALLPLAGCATSTHVSMQIPGSLADTQPLPVTGRQLFKRSYQFGSFATQRLHAGWQTNTGFAVGIGAQQGLPTGILFDQTRARRRSSFTMQPIDGVTWQAHTAYYARTQDLALGPDANHAYGLTLRGKQAYSSRIQAAGQPTWQLAIAAEQRLAGPMQSYPGVLAAGDSVFQILPITTLLRRDGQPMRVPFGVPVGYEFVRPNGMVVAAVELLGRGRIWISPTLPASTKGPIATAVTAMLLYKQ